ncbi:MAG: hypothetical protein HYX60_08410 [Legionella longbeachae]|nr:hypothetical protein [Legionella longbeachae]
MDEINQIDPQIRKMRDEKNIFKFPDKLYAYFSLMETSVTYIQNNHYVFKKHCLSNCHDLCESVSYYLYKHNKTSEIVTFRHNDHVILVMNRDPESDINNPGTWGDKALICDPLNDLVFPAKLFRDKLVGFKYDHNLKFPNINIPYDEIPNTNLKKLFHISSNHYESSKIHKILERKIKKFKLVFENLINDNKYLGDNEKVTHIKHDIKVLEELHSKQFQKEYLYETRKNINKLFKKNCYRLAECFDKSTIINLIKEVNRKSAATLTKNLFNFYSFNAPIHILYYFDDFSAMRQVLKDADFNNNYSLLSHLIISIKEDTYLHERPDKQKMLSEIVLNTLNNCSVNFLYRACQIIENLNELIQDPSLKQHNLVTFINKKNQDNNNLLQMLLVDLPENKHKRKISKFLQFTSMKLIFKMALNLNQQQSSAFHIAAYTQNTSLFQYFHSQIKQEEDEKNAQKILAKLDECLRIYDFRDNQYRTPLVYALQNKNERLVSLLCNLSNARLNSKHPSLANTLINRGTPHEPHFVSPLFMAIELRNLKLVTILLNAGANPSQNEDCGNVLTLLDKQLMEDPTNSDPTDVKIYQLIKKKNEQINGTILLSRETFFNQKNTTTVIVESTHNEFKKSD